ncbi:MAG: sensor histidine kinase [Treponema sp.]|jgi:two-component system sensor histidine kinase HydH|nr:sensor histidine kinase [Treponema sp.]
MKGPKTNMPIRTLSAMASLLCWALLAVLTVSAVFVLRDRARLIRDNDNERIVNTLFTSLRNHNDFGAAVESTPALRNRIAGIAVYGADLRPLYQWGDAPPVFDEDILGQKAGPNRFGRYTIPDPRGPSVKFILYTGLPPPPPEPRERDHHRMTDRNRQNSGGIRRDADATPQDNRQPFPPERRGAPFFNILAGGRYLYIDISHPAYWRTQTLSAVFLPLAIAALLAAAFYFRFLYLRNREYRERIEAQRNLVVLGTAASTLAHEIKNPLLSIRLQTGILEKTFPEKSGEEIGLINQEVDRLSALVYRVNDYLREAAGNPAPLNLYNLVEETSRRLCGKSIIRDSSIREAEIFADPDRIRSALENIIRNALESGSPPEEIGISISRGVSRKPAASRTPRIAANMSAAGKTTGGRAAVIIQIFDRGAGIEPANLKGDPPRIFDPFFTSKSAGTGIGLSICRRFIEAAGGSIVLENREGGGVSATVTFPEYCPPENFF